MIEGIIKTNLNKADLEQFRDTFSKLKGYPIRGLHVNTNGKNVDLDGVAKDGWTLNECEIFQNTISTDWVHVVDAQMEEDLLDTELQKNVTAGELTFLQTEAATKVILDGTWIPAG